MSKQVLDVQQMQHLQELGLDTSNASMCWLKTPNGRDLAFNDEWINLDESILDPVPTYLDPVPAYTLHDVLDKLPKEINSRTRRFWLRIDLEDECLYYYYDNLSLVEIRKKVFGYNGMGELIDAAYKMLCWAIEKKFVETNKK